jgi:hypothetical protein
MIMSTSDETIPKSRAHAMAKSRERRVVVALGRIIETDAKQKFKMLHRPGFVRAWKIIQNLEYNFHERYDESIQHP